MARRARGSARALLTHAEALRVERVRFLNAVDRAAPHLWPELVAAARAVWNVVGSRDGKLVLLHERAVQEWADRHSLGAPWVVAMALERLHQARAAGPWTPGALGSALGRSAWRALDDDETMRAALALDQVRELHRPTGRVFLPMPAPAPRRDPGEGLLYWADGEPEAYARRRFELFIAEERKRREAAGRARFQPAPDRDLDRVARWQLGESVEAIAVGELAGRFGADEEKAARARRTRAEDVRDVVKALAKRIALPARRRGEAGRPPRFARHR